MRRDHFERLKPLCPVCRNRGSGGWLAVASVVAEVEGQIVEGALRCLEESCLSEFPVIDGIPLIVGNLRSYVSSGIDQIYGRGDLSAETESLLGDCCGPGSAFDVTRQQLSIYGWDHYGDPGAEAGSAMRVLARGLELVGTMPDGPVLDVGCAVGGTTFEVAARTGRMALGVDLSFAMLRVAAAALREGRVCYPLRRVGLVYDRQEAAVEVAGSERVDFWAGDALALPFEAGAFAGVVALNILDCVSSPLSLLLEIARVLAPGGWAILATPYDWSPHATPVEAWIGGHSQRGPAAGAGEPMLRALLARGSHPNRVEGLELVAEELEVPWRVRMHSRSTIDYRVHLAVARKSSIPRPAPSPAGSGLSST